MSGQNYILIYPNEERFIEGNPSTQALIGYMKNMGADYKIICPGAKVVNGKGESFRLAPAYFKLPAYFLCSMLAECFREEEFSAIIAVDPDGTSVFNPLIKNSKISTGYISYEIRCTDEAVTEQDALRKKLELECIPFFDVFMVSDKWRAELLEKYSSVPREKMIYAPVGPVGAPADIPESIKKDLKASYNLPADKKLLVYSGAVGEWAVMEWLPYIADDLPEGWLFVFTGYVQAGSKGALILNRQLRKRNNVVFMGKLSYPEYQNFLTCCDAGLALYPTPFGSCSFYTNLSVIGLSSGKISEYIHAGLPVLVSEQKEFREISEGYPCFKTFDHPRKFRKCLLEIDSISNEAMKKYIADIFVDLFNPEDGIKAFFDGLKNSGKRGKLNVGDMPETGVPVLPVETQLAMKIVERTFDLWFMKYGSPELTVFCAGQHTEWLLSNFREHAFLKNIKLIVDENSERTDIHGIGVARPLADNSVTHVLISTDTFYSEISFRAKCFFPSAEILNIYEGLNVRGIRKC